jgi:hypothetical protein
MDHHRPAHPRTMHSAHPGLASMAAAGLSHFPEHPEEVTHRVPYPTPQQFAASERAYRQALQDGTPGAVRQPPSMLAAMQRPDLTPEARQKLLRQMAPGGGGALEKKYKVVFSSDARRDPLRTSTHDFTVDVTPGVVPCKVHGFEVIGYSFPQSEWTIEPNETAIPARHGWCPAPGARCFSVVCSTFSAGQLTAASGSPAGEVVGVSLLHSVPEFRFDGESPVALVAELPLPSNPIVRVEVLPADGLNQLPRRLRLTFARRVGSVSAALCSVAAFTLEGLAGLPIPYYTITTDGVLDEVVTELVANAEPPAPEPPVELRPSASGATSPMHTLTLTDSVLLSYFPSDGLIAELDGTEEPPLSLGLLRVRPPSTAAELGLFVSRQFKHLITHRKFLESQTLSAPRCPVRQVSLAWVAPTGMAREQRSADANGTTSLTSAFRLSVNWELSGLNFDVHRWIQESLRAGMPRGAIDAQVCPLLRTSGDRMPEMFGLPTTQPEELVHLDTLSATFSARRVPLISAQLTPDTAPVPDNAPIEFFFQALNATAATVRFQGAGGTGSTFQLPIRDADGTLHLVAVPAGEYRPWGLAAAMTRALRGTPALASLRLVAVPVFIGPDENSVLGFRFESLSPVPQVFGLAFDLPTDTNPSVIHATRLGFRTLAYVGQTVYDPRWFSPGSSVITFAATELGLGVPSPLPSVPYFLPSYSNRRLQVHVVGHEPVQASPLGSFNTEDPSLATSAASVPALRAALATPALFYNTQPLGLQTSVDPGALLIDGTLGVNEAAAPSGMSWTMFGSMMPYVPAEQGLGPGRAAGILSAVNVAAVLSLFHAPTITLQARTLAQTWVALFGQAGVTYGPGVSVAQDGDLRSLANALQPTTRLPTLAQLDDLLRRVAAWQDVRATSAALTEVLLKTLAAQNVPFGSLALPGNNGGVSAGTFASALAAHLSLSGSSSLDLFITDPWGDLYATLLRKSVADSTLRQPVVLASPPAFLIPGVTYSFPASVSVTTASAGVQQSFAVAAGSRLTLLPGIAAGAGPHTITVAVPSLSWSNVFTIAHFHEGGTGITPAAPPALVRGQRAAMSYNPAAVNPDVPNCQGVSDVVVDSARAVVYFTVNANAADARIAYTLVANPSVMVLSVLPTADSALTRLAKLFLVVRAGRVTVRAAALRDVRGTERHPFDAAAALRDLGVAPSQEITPLELFEAGDPGVAAPGELSFFPLVAELPFADELAPVFGGLDTRPVMAQVLLAAGTFAVTRTNVHPYSLDFTSRTASRIRPERLGLLEDEYMWGGSAMGSVTDIDRSGPPYLLLSIQINGSPTEPEAARGSTLQAAPSGSLHNFSENSSLTSIGNSLDPARDRQIIRATAYVQLGSDGNTLRLLDRQDDRSPVFYPTGMHINWVRFVVLRPDGTPYNFHGRKTMVALRFLGQPDNPNFIAAGTA